MELTNDELQTLKQACAGIMSHVRRGSIGPHILAPSCYGIFEKLAGMEIAEPSAPESAPEPAPEAAKEGE